MKRILLFLFLCMISIFDQVKSQNFVPNSSFEVVRRMPDRKNNGITCAKGWMSPTNTRSDYYHTGSGRIVGSPRNIFGKQQPHSGSAYAGICIRKKYIEYLEVKLVDTLIKNQHYQVEFYISRSNRSLTSVNQFGILLTNGLLLISEDLGIKGISKVPTIDFKNPSKYKNKGKWIKLSEVYKANGNETVLVLGYFNYDRPKYRGFCHYYIDDVSITPIKKKTDSLVNLKKEVAVVNIETKDSIPEIFAPKPGEAIILKNIFFAINKSDLLPTSFPELNQLVKYLNEAEGTSIEINGYTDNTGNEDRNKMLSKARAKAVADYLMTKGIGLTRIRYMGYGSSNPIASNDTEEGKQLNRRVEFMILKNN